MNKNKNLIIEINRAMDLIEEIKNKINVLDLAIDLGLQPKNGFIKSIYKDEKNASLKLYEKTNTFYCYSTGRGGDVINFYADIKNIDNREAIKLLTEDLGIKNNGNIRIEKNENTYDISEKRKIEYLSCIRKFL